ncbi:MAG: hypothetical protein ABSH22_02135 [Tepidisphaeraceae bacterium]|jgi:hypothetical protein
MGSKPEHLELEGAWEEIVLKGEQLAGRRVRVTTIDEVDQKTLHEALERFLGQKTVADSAASTPRPEGAKAEVCNDVAEKLLRQGFNV